MTAAKNAARLGTAAFVLGISLGGPYLAVAAADSSEAGPTAGPSAASSRAGTAGPAHTARNPISRTPNKTGSRGMRLATSDLFGDRPPRSASAASSPQSNAGAAGYVATSGDPLPRGRSARPSTGPTAPAVGAPTSLLSTAHLTGPTASSILNADCSACWGAAAPSITQGITTAVNHLFNSAFTSLSRFPSNPISDLIGGALVLVRRTLFLVPEGVTASQVGNSLTVAVNTGSVVYLRQNGASLQISGDPSFVRAATFTTTPNVVVSVNNPGNAGCAGLVLTSGEVLGSLQTSQIDSIRFGSTATVDGTVSASVTVGDTLVLRDAVRSKHGINLYAPVILANDVAVDAGDGNVTFADTVDAARAGKQSLTVTALGTTRFDAAVGGRTPLASLVTQGIAPLVIPQSANTATIPLHYLPEFSTTGQAQVKYGIDVAIGDNPSQMYEFDTGGVAFFAGYNSAFWQNTPLSATPVSETYSSGNYYNGVVASTRITLGTGTHTVSTTQPIQIAAILNGGNTDGTFVFTNPDAPPVEDHFFGDFGASFDTLAVPGLGSSLANPLLQLPGNLSSGFLVQLGPIGIQPQLSVGVTDDLRAQFTYAVPVTPQPGGGTYPVSGYPVLSWFGFSPSYSAQQGDQPPQQIGITSTLPSLIDSGAPSTGVRTQGLGGDPFNVGGKLQAGTTFIADFPTTKGRPPLKWTFEAGDNGSVNLVNYEQGEPGGIQNVNTGLNLYNEYDVMFDVAQQVIWLRPTGGQSTVTLNSVSTTGSQTYRQNANLSGVYSTGGGDFSVAGVTTLLGTTTVNAGGGDVRFSGTVDADTGAESLVVNSTGSTTLARAVGGLQPLSSVTTDAGGSTSTASVTTTGSQLYGDPISLNGSYSVSNGSFSAAGSTTLAGPTSISGGDIVLNGPIDSAANKGYQLTLTPGDGDTASLNGDVGTTNPLGGITVSATGGGSATINAPGYVALAGNLGFSADKGLSIGKGVTATFTGGGLIQGFADSGVVIGQATDSVIRNFAISSNGGNGIQIDGAQDTVIEQNVVLNNGSDGVLVSAGSGNQILSNSIFGNGGTSGLGIHLEVGANNNQPPPDLHSATLDSGSLTVAFTVLPPNSGDYTVQIFYSPAGAGTQVQGQQLLQTLSDVHGQITANLTAPADVSAGGYITLTATSADGDTSQFSTAAQITT